MHYLYKKLNLIAAISLAFIISPSSSYAYERDKELDELLEMDLEDLISISVASKKEEVISEAPSIVSVITRDEINKYGAVNLLDVFNRSPSLQVISSTFTPNNILSIRAATNQHYTNRVLFLIDGRPFRDSHTGGWNMSLFTEYPVSNIEQIEIIRGPGSVLYGTNAFSGVINIVTRKDSQAEASVTYGSFGRRQVEGRTHLSGKDWSLVTAVKKSNASGYRYTLTDENSITDSYKHGEVGYGVSLQGNYKRLTLNAFRGRLDQTVLGAFAKFPASDFDIARTMIDVGYQQPLSNGWQADFNITYNGRRNAFNSGSTAPNSEDAVLLEVSTNGNISENIHLLTGGSLEHQDGVIVGSKYQNKVYNAYVQLDWKASDWLKLVGGVQLNDSADIQSHFSPRAAAIITINENWSTKLLYGEAFRAGTALESFIDLPGRLVGSNIQPETIKSSEIQVSYNNNNFSTSLTAYHSKIEDIIGRISHPTDTGLLVTNTGDQNFRGVEFEGRYIIGNGWSMQGSAALQKGESDTGEDNPTFYPNIMSKLGVVYDANDWSIALFDSWYGTPEQIRETDLSVSDVNPKADSYHLVSLNANVSLNAVMNLPSSIAPIDFNIFVENLLDENINFPEFNRKNINSIPIESGRAIFASVTVKF